MGRAYEVDDECGGGDMRLATVTSTSPLRVKPDGSTASLRASYRVGSAPALNDRVLYQEIEGRKVVVFAITAV